MVNKLLILLLSCFAFQSSFSQGLPPLTRGDVYDFQVGDVFQRVFGGSGGLPGIVWDSVTSVQAGNDTIIYNFHTINLSANYNGGADFISAGPTTETISGLGAVMTRPYVAYFSPNKTTDTTFANSNYMNRVLTHYVEMDTSPLPTGFSRTFWGTGLGLCEFYFTKPPLEIDIYLNYYRKGGEVFGDLITDVQEAEYFEDPYLVYPNPFQDMIRLSLRDNWVDGVAYEIHDLNGRILRKGRIEGTTDMDLSSLPTGSYWLRLIKEDHVEGMRITKIAR